MIVVKVLVWAFVILWASVRLLEPLTRTKKHMDSQWVAGYRWARTELERGRTPSWTLAYLWSDEADEFDKGALECVLDWREAPPSES